MLPATLALAGVITFFANQTIGLIPLGLSPVLLVLGFFSEVGRTSSDHPEPVEPRENDAANLRDHSQRMAEFGQLIQLYLKPRFR
jgi:hypothetical protein